MKALILAIVAVLLVISGDGKRADVQDIKTRGEFWKAHAYVELRLMQLRVNTIIENKNNNNETK